MGDTLRDLDHESRRTTDDYRVGRDIKREEWRKMTERKYYAGIDPGFTGAIAIIDDHQRIVECHDMPLHGIKSKPEIDCNKVIFILRVYSLSHIAIEKAQAMPKQGCVSMFRYGKVAGLLEGIITTLNIPYTLITPQAWKKRMMQGMDKGKGASIVRAEQLFNFHSTRKKDHGQAEACLLAEYGRLLITGKERSETI